VEKKKNKDLTELQKNFIVCLFSEESKGNPVIAKRMAGYADTVKTSELVESLYDEILEYGKKYLAANSPQAIYALFDTLVNPSQMGGTNKLKAAQDVLDRVGVDKRKEATDTLKIPESGLVILPAKSVRIDVDTTSTARPTSDTEE
jgi:hypothetical protein